MVNVDTIKVSETVSADNLVVVSTYDMNRRVQRAHVFVDGSSTIVELYDSLGSPLDNIVVTGDTVTLATFFEDLAKAIRGEN